MARGRVLIIVALIAFASVATAAAVGPTVRWTVKDMKTAIRAIGYPKPHPRRLTCRGLGADEGTGRFTAFRCVATYRRRRVFYAQGQGEGGWICAGSALATCKVLRKGFVTTATVSTQGLAATADVAARGYLVDHDQFPYQVVHFCTQVGTTAWSCPFIVNNAPVSVSLSIRQAKGGYVISGDTS